jgi:hypothetical protein
MAIPGMIGAITIERPIDSEDGFGFSQPIIQFFGEVTPARNTKYYIDQIKNLSKACLSKFEENPEGKY